jgi:hypothetical protein
LPGCMRVCTEMLDYPYQRLPLLQGGMYKVRHTGLTVHLFSQQYYDNRVLY